VRRRQAVHDAGEQPRGAGCIIGAPPGRPSIARKGSHALGHARREGGRERERKERLGRRRGRFKASGVDRQEWEVRCHLRQPRVRSGVRVDSFFFFCDAGEWHEQCRVGADKKASWVSRPINGAVWIDGCPGQSIIVKNDNDTPWASICSEPAPLTCGTRRAPKLRRPSTSRATRPRPTLSLLLPPHSASLPPSRRTHSLLLMSPWLRKLIFRVIYQLTI
jgi:hypothetical protein